MSQQFEKGQTVFYRNKQCEFICDVDVSEAVVSFEDAFDVGVKTNYIINKKFLSDKELTFDDCHESIFNKMKEIEREQLNQLRMRISAQETKYRETIVSLEAKKNELLSSIKKYELLKPFLDYLDGKIKYVVHKSSYPKIVELDKTSYVDGRRTRFRAFKLQRADDDNPEKAKFTLLVSQYSDGSGCVEGASFHENLDSAISTWEKLVLESLWFTPEKQILEQYGITNATLWERVKKEELEQEEKRKKEVARLEADLQKLKQTTGQD